MRGADFLSVLLIGRRTVLGQINVVFSKQDGILKTASFSLRDYVQPPKFQFGESLFVVSLNMSLNYFKNEYCA